MVRLTCIIIGIVMLALLCAPANGIERFPPPDFESGYELLVTTTPSVRSNFYEYVDIGVLFVLLCLASYLVLKLRSRKAIFVLMVFSLLYFGFWRKGCICSIGAIQNIVLAFSDSGYAVPVSAVVFFLLPLVFTLFFGRVFCAAVCPLGAIQDVVLLRPIAISRWLESGLRLFAYIYLAVAVLFAATGSAFIICRYDPFISFFRLSGNLNILILGGCFLLIGLFVGRPYCRFVCPYGIVLRQLSRISKWRVTITPDECVKCRLCADSCPFGAIREPSAEWPVSSYYKDKKRLAILLVTLPVLIVLFGWAGSNLKGPMSRVDSTVRLAERIYAEEAGEVEGLTDASEAFRATGESVEELYGRALAKRDEFTLGGWLFGGFVGLAAGLKLIGLSVRRKYVDYEADRAGCVGCGRCYAYCPKEKIRVDKAKEGGG